MEHITDIDKTAHLEECVEAVREIINPDDYGLTEEALYVSYKRNHGYFSYNGRRLSFR